MELKVRMCCEGCERVVRQALQNLRGTILHTTKTSCWTVTLVSAARNAWLTLTDPDLALLYIFIIYVAAGVDRVDVNVPMEKVTVTGYVDRARVLQEVRRSGKKAEFWPSGGTPLWFTSPRSYFRDDGGSYRRDSYNYRRHGYSDGDRHGRMREPARGAGPVGNMFNDDDVNAACRIM